MVVRVFFPTSKSPMALKPGAVSTRSITWLTSFVSSLHLNSAALEMEIFVFELRLFFRFLSAVLIIIPKHDEKGLQRIAIMIA